MVNIVPTYTAVMSPANLRSGAMANGDQPLQRPPYKQITGHVYDVNGAPVVGATVLLFLEDGNLFLTSTTTLSQGEYYFDRSATDTRRYYTTAFTLAGGTVQVHGTSDRGLVPS